MDKWYLEKVKDERCPSRCIVREDGSYVAINVRTEDAEFIIDARDRAIAAEERVIIKRGLLLQK